MCPLSYRRHVRLYHTGGREAASAPRTERRGLHAATLMTDTAFGPDSGPADLYIGGKWLPARDGRRFDVINPSTGDALASVADAGVPDALAAVEAAHAAGSHWASTAPRDRAEILRRAFELMTAQAEEYARLISLENGKALPDARGEVAYAAEFFRWYAEE